MVISLIYKRLFLEGFNRMAVTLLISILFIIAIIFKGYSLFCLSGVYKLLLVKD